MQPHNPNQSILNEPLGRVAGKLTNSLVVALVQGNWFYVLSGILMVIGCHQLVRSIMPTGSELVRTTISLGILQAYEILVIATAILIVNKFRMLGDAFVLFLVELALLVDPTFFSNALGTMPDRRGLLVNTACLALVPIKLLILQRFLSVRISRAGWIGLLLLGAIIYLSPWPLMAKKPVLTLHGTYYAIGWALALAAACMSPLRSLVTVSSPAPNYVTTSQLIWMPRVVLALPVVVAVAHYLESSSVHTIPFFPAFVAPIFMIAALIISRNVRGGEHYLGRLVLVDLLSFVALLLSLEMFNQPDNLSMRRPAHAQPTMMLTSLPLLIAGTAVIGNYLLFYANTRARAVLWRFALAAAVGMIAVLIRSGFIETILKHVANGTGLVWSKLTTRPELTWGAAAAIALLLAIRKHTYYRWFAAGLLTIIFAAHILPAPTGSLLPEALQAFVLLGVVLSYRFGDDREELQRMAALLVVCAIAFFRYLSVPATWTAAIVNAQIIMLLAGALLFRRWSLGILGLIVASAFLMIKLRMSGTRILAAPLMIVGGLGMFAFALFVTFRKKAWLEALAADSQLESVPHESVSPTGKQSESEPS